MRRIYTLCAILVMAHIAFAQDEGVLKEYRRNSLGTVLVYHPEDEFSPQIMDAFDSIPLPDKYDDHNTEVRLLCNDNIPGPKKNSTGLIKTVYGKLLTAAEVKKNGLALENYLNDNNIGTLLVAKWFNLDVNATNQEDLHFDMKLIQERGQYNASDLDVEHALLTTRGVSLLSDAGEELLHNTFVLVNDITYVTAEQKAKAAKAAMNVIGGIFDGLFGGHAGQDMADISGAIADSFTGFTVRTHSYLYQLDWNDSIAAIFYNDYYTEHFDQERLMRFVNDKDLFKVHFVAHEYEFDEKSVLKGQYDRKELIKMVCTRSIDKNIASLQLQYEDFKVKTPVYEYVEDAKGRTIGYAAKIGLKEGITEKSSFQVIQRYTDEKTNKTKYRYIATVKPMKGKIWDNRYNAVLEGDKGSELNYTTFKKVSGGEILPGMLIIEGKYKKVTE